MCQRRVKPERMPGRQVSAPAVTCMHIIYPGGGGPKAFLSHGIRLLKATSTWRQGMSYSQDARVL